MKVKVILLEDVKSVGKKDEIVEVKEGYAHNFLIKNKKGVLATDETINKLTSKKNKKDKEDRNIKENALKLKEIIESKEITLKVKTGENNKVFGSISNKDISDEIKKEFNLDIDKKKIHGDTSRMKELGSHTAEIKLHKDVPIELKINLISD